MHLILHNTVLLNLLFVSRLFWWRFIVIHFVMCACMFCMFLILAEIWSRNVWKWAPLSSNGRILESTRGSSEIERIWSVSYGWSCPSITCSINWHATHQKSPPKNADKVLICTLSVWNMYIYACIVSFMHCLFSYKAGLDTKEDMTGKESLYTEFNGK